jgi:NAD(P)-dependent dehydrogenase (short-subunit alcohol dehydrogenase family)
MSTSNKVAIVTGASSGIGRQTAVLLAGAGWHVALVGRSVSGLAQTAAEAAKAATGGAATCSIEADLEDTAAAAKIVTQTAARFGGVDALAHVAGDAPYLDLETVTAEVWRRCVDINLTSAMLLGAAVWPIFLQRGGGVIVNVSSMASVDPFPGLEIYACAKVGLNMLTLGQARRGEPVNIRAVAVAPGAVETPMLRRLFGTDMLPRDRTLDPGVVAQVIVDCVTGKRACKVGELVLVPSP